ncbi:MAG: tRNA (N6-isopentenyl adenosine(37)-C2)-methylthiotransferase MiaB [Nitrospirota bacterium]
MLNFMMQKSVFIYTFGCQMNVHDSEKMLGILSKDGYAIAENPEKADLIIFNTCAIREKAEQKFYSQLGRTKLLKKRNPGLKIAVAGCVAQDARQHIFRKAPHVDFIFGPQNISLMRDMLNNNSRKTSLEENKELAYIEFETQRQSSIKAWVSIMYGCNNFCSYCIVPYTRGGEVSRPSSSILSEIEDLCKKGYKEVTLLGQNVNSYRSDMGFTDLLKKIDSVNMRRVRFVTSHPRDLSSELINAISELPSVCEHIHLPLQSGSDRILDLMNRGYAYSQYYEKIQSLRDEVPGIAITTDIITGFPGEDEDDFKKTVNALEEIEFDGIFAFKFSPRRGTRASEMEGSVSDDIKTERLNHILRIQEEITYRKNRTLEGTAQEILVEGHSETDRNMLMGRTRTNKIVTIADSGEKEGSFIKVMIRKARQHSLDGINIDPETVQV